MNTKTLLIAGAALVLPLGGAMAQDAATPNEASSAAGATSPGNPAETGVAGSRADRPGLTAERKTSNAPVAAASGAVTTGAGSVSQSTSPSSAATAPGTSATPGAAGPSASSSAAPAAGAPTQVSAVTLADLQKGAQVIDTSGAPVGTIESVTPDGAVVSTGAARAQIPLTGFGKSDKGIVLGMTKAELEKAAGGAAAKPTSGS